MPKFNDYNTTTSNIINQDDNLNLTYINQEVPSLYYFFPLYTKNNYEPVNVSMLGWTTTPYTLNEDFGTCYNVNSLYVIIKIEKKNYVLAYDSLHRFSKVKWFNYDIVKITTPDFLANLCYFNPLMQTFKPLVPTSLIYSFVGTGFMHLCPYYSLLDYQIYKNCFHDTKIKTDHIALQPNGQIKKNEELFTIRQANNLILEDLTPFTFALTTKMQRQKVYVNGDKINQIVSILQK